jgi:hypothetical protein
MSQPPYPPPGGSDSPGQQPGAQGWGQPEEPTEQIGQPAPPTSQFQPGQYGAPGGGNDQTAQFGQPQYGQPGQPQFGQPAYGQPQYGQPQYGGPGGPGGPVPPPGYGPGGPGGSSGGSGKLIAIIAAVVVVLAGAGVGLFFLLKDDGDDNTPAASSSSSVIADPSSAFDEPSGSSSSGPVDCESPSGSPSPGVPEPEDPCDITEADPDGDFTPLAEDCAAEDWSACDELWGITPVDSDWEQYGGTCGGRVSYQAASCVDRFEGGGDSGGSTGSAPTATSAPVPPGNLGDDPDGTFAPLAQDCFNGDYQACDQLWITTPVGSDWEQYAGTCAGRVGYESGTCESRLG